jgi:hypothetical protein
VVFVCFVAFVPERGRVARFSGRRRGALHPAFRAECLGASVEKPFEGRQHRANDPGVEEACGAGKHYAHPDVVPQLVHL